MVSPRKQAANAENAAKSTGPRTDGGKARSRMNATAHGLRAVQPVLPGEDPAQWEAFHAGVVADLGADGPLETEMAGRVALLQWRLRRVAAFEAAAVAAEPSGPDSPEALERELRRFERGHADAVRAAEVLDRVAAGGAVTGADALFLLGQALTYLPGGGDAGGRGPAAGPDAGAPPPLVETDGFLAAVGVPDSHLGDPAGWAGWTPAAVLAGFARLAATAGWTPERFLTAARRCAADDVASLAAAVAARRQGLAAAARRAAVPTGTALEAVLRYEPYLARQLADALALLERVQARRG